MIPTPIRKVYQGVADRRTMFRLFDRHAQRPNRFQDDASALYRGEYFEIGEIEHNYMFNILPPLWMRGGMFAMREFLTGSITSVFFTLQLAGRTRYFHGYCDLADKSSPEAMRAILDRELQPARSMTREERIEHIWSSTHDAYRGYAGFAFPLAQQGRRIVTVFGPERWRESRLLDELSDEEIAAKLPVHLRYLPDTIAA